MSQYRIEFLPIRTLYKFACNLRWHLVSEIIQSGVLIFQVIPRSVNLAWSGDSRNKMEWKSSGFYSWYQCDQIVLQNSIHHGYVFKLHAWR